nr:hypothetical protein [Candidatus Paceibacterota bacterium]
MSLGDSEKLNRIEELKGKLSSRNYPMNAEHHNTFSHPRRLDVPDSWEKEETKYNSPEKFFMKTSVFKKFFLFSVAFFVLALAYSAYMFFIGGNTVSNENIDLTVVGNTYTSGGDELPLIIGITNRNNSPLQLVDLIVEYPKSASGDMTQNTERLRESIGTIATGETKNDSVKVVLFGEQGSIRPIKISIEYRVEGSNAIFTKVKEYDVAINSTPIDLSIDAPSEISPNQDIVLNVKATLNATKTAPKMLLRLDYPVGFQFTSAKPMPSFGNNVWALGDLPPGSASNISVVGRMIDVFDGEEKTFRVWSGSQSLTDKSIIDVVFNSQQQTVLVKKPFIAAQLYINDVYKHEYSADSKTPIQGEIRWSNNLETKINDLQITAKISGNAFDRKTISAQQGFYNSGDNTITWNKNSQSRFAEVNPGDSGSVMFSVSPLSLFAGGSGLLSSPSINVDVSITGKQPQDGDAIKTLNNTDSKTIRIVSDLGFATKALYYSGPFTNKGAIPPKVEAPTTYTVVWTLSNSANNLSKAQVRSTLPSWMGFVGTVSPKAEDLVYNPSTKEIIWNIGNIPKGTGITTAGREVAFQVTFTPSLSQVGARPAIINDAVLTAHDDFANVDLTVNKASLSTELSNDSLFPTN